MQGCKLKSHFSHCYRSSTGNNHHATEDRVWLIWWSISGSNADTAAAEAMSGPGAKDAKNLPEATHKDSELMAADASRTERCSAAKKVLEAVRDLPYLPRPQDALSISDPLLQKR